jgi:glycosyltransferase involved in cell wall biosynthesis
VTQPLHLKCDLLVFKPFPFECNLCRYAAEEALRVFAPRVFVLPAVRDADMPALYAAADALVLPSRGEGWGRPHVEAMSMVGGAVQVESS